MAHRNQAPSLRAGGNIATASFVKISAAAENTCLQAGDNERVIGASQMGTKYPQGLAGLSNTYAAETGDEIQIFGLGDICRVRAGSGGYGSGNMLKSDASGDAVPVATTGTTVQWVAAVAIEDAEAGELGRVQLMFFAYRPALS